MKKMVSTFFCIAFFAKAYAKIIRQVSWLPSLLIPSHPLYLDSGSSIKVLRVHSCATARDSHTIPFWSV